MLLAKKQDGPDQKKGTKSGARSRAVPPGGDPVEELYERAGTVLHETGAVPAALLAAVIKLELATVRKQAGSPSPSPSTGIRLNAYRVTNRSLGWTSVSWGGGL